MSNNESNDLDGVITCFRKVNWDPKLSQHLYKHERKIPNQNINIKLYPWGPKVLLSN